MSGFINTNPRNFKSMLGKKYYEELEVNTYDKIKSINIGKAGTKCLVLKLLNKLDSKSEALPQRILQASIILLLNSIQKIPK